MTNKIMIVQRTLGSDATITTIDGTKKNQIINWNVEVYSNKQLAERIVKRVEDDNFNQIYIDANGINIELVDALLYEFENTKFNYDPKTGNVFIPSIEFKAQTLTLNVSEEIYNLMNKKEEF